MTRAFVAVSPPDDVLDAVADATVALDLPGVRRTTRDQWHLTLQFLGNAFDIDAVADALAGVTARTGAVRLGGAGAFPNAKRARVLWLGVATGGDFLSALAAEVARALASLGFEPEARPYHPHLTLARCRKAAVDARPCIAALDGRDYGAAWTVSEVRCFESRLRRDGAQYVSRAMISLRP
jgi:RNA 2',3'-cyclic 3'-phosphodiesterase